MLEQVLVSHASATLAGLKLGNLFVVSERDGSAREIARLNAELLPKGLVLTTLRRRNGKALLYLYRKEALKRTLEDGRVRAFLYREGYPGASAEEALATLKVRLAGCESFPHEIGIFLGYPLEDVIGFIENCGENCLCCGCWKVYGNPQEALKCFARYRKCREVYERLFASGRPLSKLTVAARSA